MNLKFVKHIRENVIIRLGDFGTLLCFVTLKCYNFL